MDEPMTRAPDIHIFVITAPIGSTSRGGCRRCRHRNDILPIRRPPWQARSPKLPPVPEKLPEAPQPDPPPLWLPAIGTWVRGHCRTTWTKTGGLDSVQSKLARHEIL